MLHVEQGGERRHVVLTAPPEKQPAQMVQEIEQAAACRILWLIVVPMKEHFPDDNLAV